MKDIHSGKLRLLWKLDHLKIYFLRFPTQNGDFPFAMLVDQRVEPLSMFIVGS